MPRHVFFSFCYDDDCFRTNQVRHMGAIEGQRVCHANEWETIWRNGDAAIQHWIDGQMQGKSCVVVLIGTNTASRPWVNYEIRKGWNDGKGVLGINIHGLKCARSGTTSAMGASPFIGIGLNNGRRLSDYVPVYNPSGWDSQQVYNSIANNLGSWIDYAISQRQAANRAA